MKWPDEKIEGKRQYFLQQRKEPTGKFTEFVVRVYYSIYKKCSENENGICRSSDVSSYKIKNVVYEGIYDGQPDHDNKSVIDDCMKHLKEMHYIGFKKENDVWYIYIKRQLDFLLEGEHEFYKHKFEIRRELSCAT